MRDAYLEHMENRCGCADDGFELEPEADVLDRLDEALEQAWVLLQVTTAGELPQ
jgi:hypothetical protein